MTDDVLDRAQQAVNVRRPCPDCGLTDCGWQEYARLNRIGDIAPELIDALRAARTENERLRSYKSLPSGMVWQDYYSPDDVCKIREQLDAEIERLRADAADLIDRLEKASRRLDALTITQQARSEIDRLQHKRQGVQLALSYAREYQR